MSKLYVVKFRSEHNADTTGVFTNVKKAYEAVLATLKSEEESDYMNKYRKPTIYMSKDKFGGHGPHGTDELLTYGRLLEVFKEGSLAQIEMRQDHQFYSGEVRVEVERFEKNFLYT